MKKYLTVLLTIIPFLIITACTDPGSIGEEGSDNSTESETTAPAVDDNSTTNNETFSADGVSFSMVYVPDGLTFPTGFEDGDTASVPNSYMIGETEVTFELWSHVYIWASGDTNMNETIDSDETAGIYTFANAGIMGDGDGDTDQHPVTSINWRDAMIWCNALTEAYNGLVGTDYKCVYYSDADYTTPIRSINDVSGVYIALGSQDHPYIFAGTPGNISMENCTADGFRLQIESEWKLAACYIKDADNDGDICDTGEYYTYYHASGADETVYGVGAGTDFDGDGDIEDKFDVAVLGSNSDSAAAVKSKSPNALGIYDMSGNVSELCFDFFDTDEDSHTIRGSHYDATINNYICIGYRGGSAPYHETPTTGFRLAKNQ